MKVMLFWSPTCPHCPPARELIHKIKDSRKDFDLSEYQPGTAEARDKYLEYNVTSTPTFIIIGPGYPDNIGLRGSQSEKVLNKYLDIAAGKKQMQSKQSIISLLRTLFKKFN